jgi:hypothetical protein
MTNLHDSTGIAALDELGRRFQVATAQPRRRRLQQRRWLAVALGALALAATPALAAVLDQPATVEDQLPQVAAAVNYDDPAATGEALAREGFRVHWVLVTDNLDPEADSPTQSRSIREPPAGTEILSVLNERGSNEVTPGMRDLQIEVAPVGSKILNSHR